MSNERAVQIEVRNERGITAQEAGILDAHHVDTVAPGALGSSSRIMVFVAAMGVSSVAM